MKKFLLLTVGILSAAQATQVLPFFGYDAAPSPFYSNNAQYKAYLETELAKLDAKKETQESKASAGIDELKRQFEMQNNLSILENRFGDIYKSVVSEKFASFSFESIKQKEEAHKNTEFAKISETVLKAAKELGITEKDIKSVIPEVLQQFANSKKKNIHVLRGLLVRALAKFSKGDKRAWGNFWKTQGNNLVISAVFSDLLGSKQFSGKDAEEFKSLLAELTSAKGRNIAVVQKKLVAFMTSKIEGISKNLEKDIKTIEAQLVTTIERAKGVEENYYAFIKLNAGKVLSKEDQKQFAKLTQAKEAVEAEAKYLESTLKAKKASLKAFKETSADLLNVLLSKEGIAALSGMVMSEEDSTAWKRKEKAFTDGIAYQNRLAGHEEEVRGYENPEHIRAEHVFGKEKAQKAFENIVSEDDLISLLNAPSSEVVFRYDEHGFAGSDYVNNVLKANHVAPERRFNLADYTGEHPKLKGLRQKAGELEVVPEEEDPKVKAEREAELTEVNLEISALERFVNVRTLERDLADALKPKAQILSENGVRNAEDLLPWISALRNILGEDERVEDESLAALKAYGENNFHNNAGNLNHVALNFNRNALIKEKEEMEKQQQLLDEYMLAAEQNTDRQVAEVFGLDTLNKEMHAEAVAQFKRVK